VLGTTLEALSRRMLFIKWRYLLELLPCWLGTNDGRYRRGPRNLEGNQGVPCFGKIESAALDGWADSIGNSGVAENLVEMGAVHK